MMNYLYKHWAYQCAPLAFYLTLLLWASSDVLSAALFWIWIQFPCYLIHEFEEHAWPGGFKYFINREIFKLPDQKLLLDDRHVFWVNIPAIWVLFPVCAILAQHVNASIGAVLPVFALFNATLHILFWIVKKKYNPGLIVSIFINYPLGLYALWVMANNQLLDWRVFANAFGLAFLVHFIIVIYFVARYKKLKQS